MIPLISTTGLRRARNFFATLAMGCLFALPALSQSALGAGLRLSPNAQLHPGVDAGEWLLSELNCSACHTATVEEQKRLAPRRSPILSEIGSRATPQHLRAFLSDPQSVKPGTPMPDLLHALTPSARSEAVDALVHYLSSLRGTNVPAASGASAHLIQQGQRLYHTVGCVACHAPQDRPDSLGQDAFSALESASIPLGPLARKTTVDALAQFLQDPLKTRPSGRMPSLNLGRGEALAIATYLLREQASSGPKGPRVRMPGLHYDYFETLVHATAGLESAAPTLSGSVEQFTLAPKRRDEQIGFRFTGALTVPREATYTFFVASDDGAKLWIDGQVIVDNDGVHAPSEKSGKLALKAGEHSIALLYFNEYAGGELAVRWQEEGHGKRPIPSAALSHTSESMQPLEPENLALDPAKVARGETLFGSMGCAACHLGAAPGKGPSSAAPALAALRTDAPKGCLGSPGPAAARFAFSEEQRAAMRTTLSKPSKLREPLLPKAQLARTLAALNCLACHSRDGAGGPTEARNGFFTTANNEDLGDEGRMPPHLSGVGDKLRTDWIQKVLLEKAAVRPYMAARMPQFGKENVGMLPDLFEKADSVGASAAQVPAPSAADEKFGRQLVGTGGLSCIACHVFSGRKSLGVPALDLTMISQRLKHDWFARYLVDPAALRPGTRMPSFWPEGKAANKDILNGDTSRQIEAIWNYLAAGRAAKLPEGLVPVGVELKPSNEAVLYRHFIEGGGSRAIGVGYPEKANLAFDANQLRLALIWHGKFIDAGKHRRDRGDGYQPPLGDDVLRLPEGAPFARLGAADAPWPAESGKSAGYQMKGYQLDALQRPAFRYTFSGVNVEDYTMAFAHEPEPGLRRRIQLRSDTALAGLYFRAAVGAQILQKGGGYQVDNRLTLRFQLPPGATPIIRKSGGASELLIPLNTTATSFELTEELTW
ncbi:MAG: c-type cytochrome [Verrucomicrobia bacterium]|nr:c-type cytochrome [Verrucomicrobiota bacterium]MBI3867175.1 c-type cytochrome [Verrucomicrobiota bacterium]